MTEEPIYITLYETRQREVPIYSSWLHETVSRLMGRPTTRKVWDEPAKSGVPRQATSIKECIPRGLTFQGVSFPKGISGRFTGVAIENQDGVEFFSTRFTNGYQDVSEKDTLTVPDVKLEFWGVPA